MKPSAIIQIIRTRKKIIIFFKHSYSKQLYYGKSVLDPNNQVAEKFVHVIKNITF